MKIETRFSIGDKIYTADPVKFRYPTKNVNCDICDSTGKVTIKDQEFICPKCRGKEETIHNVCRKRYPNPSMFGKKVGYVSVVITDSEKEIKYMCKETGIKTGRLYDDSLCFATYQEVFDFVESENKKFEEAEIKEYGYVLPEF